MTKFSVALFHGRTDPTESMDIWGFDGPVLGPFEHVQLTYGSLVLYPPTGERFDLGKVDDLFFYDGAYFGDVAIYDAEYVEPTARFDLAKSAPLPQRCGPVIIPLAEESLPKFRALTGVFVDCVKEQLGEQTGVAVHEALKRLTQIRPASGAETSRNEDAGEARTGGTTREHSVTIAFR